MDITKITKNNLFTEFSQFKFTGKKDSLRQTLEFEHVQTGEIVSIGSTYVENFLISADHYEKEVFVGKEDKYWTQKQIDYINVNTLKENEENLREGDLKQLGIRSIFLEIPKKQVFTVCFERQAKPIGKTAYKTALLDQRKILLNKFEEAYSRKKDEQIDMVDQLLQEIQENRVETEIAEDRVLRGYKLVNHSPNGIYDCIDLDAEGYNRRKVTITKIKWLIVDNVKYIVK